MSLRTRLLIAFTAVVLVPIALLAFGVRQEMSRRLSAEYQLRVDTAVEMIRSDLRRESDAVGDRLASLQAALLTDNRFRLAAVAGVDTEREYLLDYAGTAMRLTGLSMLQIQDADGRILSSGHFRNEHGRTDAALPSTLTRTPGVAMLLTRGPEREFLALARSASFTMSGQAFTLVGGVAVDDAFLDRLAPSREVAVTLKYGGRQVSTSDEAASSGNDVAIGALQIPLIQNATGTTTTTAPAQLEVSQSLTPLRRLVESADTWFLLTAFGAVVIALILAGWVSSRISRPITALADKTAVLDLDRLDVQFESGTDEVGRLSNLLGDLAARLRTSTVRIRDAERRATVGDMARQVNHDIKNGLIPLRNVVRHLAQVERDNPHTLPTVFGERRPTMESSLAYLETLAASYQRLSTPLERRDCDLNMLIADVARATHGHHHVAVDTDLAPVAPVVGDPLAFRRIFENLIANAVDSLHGNTGRITLSTRVVERPGDVPLVRITVADTGRGMPPDEARRIFDDFYTTKEGGTGLGLSIVRRLVMDLHGTISVDSAPGAGTRMIIDVPAGGARRA